MFSKSRFTTVSLPSFALFKTRSPTHSWMPCSCSSQLCCVAEPAPVKVRAMSSGRRSFGVTRDCAAFCASVNFVWNVLKSASRVAAVMFMSLPFLAVVRLLFPRRYRPTTTTTLPSSRTSATLPTVFVPLVLVTVQGFVATE